MRHLPSAALTLSGVLALAGCGGSSSATTAVTSTVVVTATATPTGTPTPSTTSPTPTPTPSASADATTAMLATAVVPRFNDRPMMRLAGGRARLSGYECALDRVPPVLADVDGDGAQEAVGSVTCSGGTSSWPAEVLVVDGDGSTLTSYSTARPGQMHSTVDAITAQPGAVTLRWHTFDVGRGTPTEYTGSLRVQNRLPVFVPTAAPRATTPTTTPDGSSTAAPSVTTTGKVTRVSGPGIGFVSPSGKILCSMSDTSVRCDVLSAQFAAPPRPASCPHEWGYSFDLEPGRKGAFACQNDPSYSGGDQAPPAWFLEGLDATVAMPNGDTAVALGYGHVLANANLSCVVDKATGVTCRTTDGAHGFTASRRSYRVW